MDINLFKSVLTQLLQHPVAGSIGALSMGVFSFLYGDSKLALFGMSMFVAVIAMDWISGYSAARKDGSYASEYGIDGAFRTFFILFFPVIAHQADKFIGFPNVIFGFCLLAFGIPIWKSMTANVIRCGWDRWVPIWALNWVTDELEHKAARAKRRLEAKQIMKEDDM